MKTSVLVVALIVFTGLCVPVNAALDYDVVELGTLGGPTSVATDINNRGEVTGSAGHMPKLWGAVHAFYWSRETGMIDITPSAQRDSTYANAMNDRGQIVGAAQQHAFVWSKRTGLLDLGTLGGYISSANDINDLGTVVGTSDTSGPMHAFVWTEQDGILDLGIQGQESFGMRINEAGVVLGSKSLGGDAHRPFVWSEKAGITDLGTLGGYSSSPFAINRFGEVVGSSRTAFGDVHAFFWSERTGIIDIAPFKDITPLGGQPSVAKDINNKGQVVLRADIDGSPRGFVWDARHLTLQEIGLPSQTEDYVEELSINDSGLVAGHGWISGEYRAFVWTARDGVHLLPTLGGFGSYFKAMNERGEIVGGAQTPSGEYRAVLWVPQQGSHR